MMRKIIMAAAALLLVGVVGCSPIVKEAPPAASSAVKEDYNPAHYPVTISTLNSKGEPIEETFQKPPERVVCVWQNSIENLLALGVGDRIQVAMGLPNAKYLRPEYREAYERIPYTSMENLDMETMMMRQPDFIVGWASTFGPKVLRDTDFWISRGIHTYISPGSSPKVKDHTLDYEYQDILNLGKVFDKEDRANELVNQMKEEISSAQAKAEASGRHPRGLIIEFLGKNINVYGPKTLAGNILTSMGGELLDPGYVSISKEQLLELNPDVIFVVVIESHYGQEDQILDQLYQEKALQSLKCIQEKRVYPLPLYSIYSAGVRAYDGIQIIGKGLYPEEG